MNGGRKDDELITEKRFSTFIDEYEIVGPAPEFLFLHLVCMYIQKLFYFVGNIAGIKTGEI